MDILYHSKQSISTENNKKKKCFAAKALSAERLAFSAKNTVNGKMLVRFKLRDMH